MMLITLSGGLSMDFIEQLQSLSAKIQKQRDVIQTEEATKNAFVLPFINSLGYDIFDPSEVVPEFTADMGIKKGEKVDYAIVRDGKVIMLFECKKCGTDMGTCHASQLYRYFSVTEARIGILTDGILYHFYTDIEQPNKMDSKPFMEFNLLDIQESFVAELKKLSKPVFNLTEIITVAGDLKYTKEIKRILHEQLNSPSEDFTRFFACQVYPGKLTQGVREQFSAITKRAFAQFINERINERLRTALDSSEIPKDPAQVEQAASPEKEAENAVVTTAEELEGFFIVKAILRETVDPARIAHRDKLNYFGILLDDNNRKPICRLYLNRKQKYISFFDVAKNEARVAIADLNEIYKHAERLKAAVHLYDQKAGGE